MIDPLNDAVGNFRRAIEWSDFSGEGHVGVLRMFPRACCKPASMFLARYLVEELDYQPVEYVFGIKDRNLDGRTGWWPHGWLEHRGVIIDITADQFADIQEPSIVTTDRWWHDQFQPHERFSYENVMRMGGRFEDKFNATYAEIVRHVSRASAS